MMITEKWNDQMKYDEYSGYQGKNERPRCY